MVLVMNVESNKILELDLFGMQNGLEILDWPDHRYILRSLCTVDWTHILGYFIYLLNQTFSFFITFSSFYWVLDL
jgi:hypothetical protein